MTKLNHEARKRQSLVTERGSYDDNPKYGTGTCHLCGHDIRIGDRLRSWNREKK